ncbi:GIY-YIG nuclease family protein [Microterricola viridarii]|uniref:T5orf172 domain-containing protein n=1 Tax=Microterricola viridarii TaxID=412690 RepID=A0A1H1YLK6_9MICO|nr:GIY-YIG nuclease family protein [Microterricola viridarii]SDT22312.1 T5orf172 domain-containing protein [Microterricola viridarii]
MKQWLTTAEAARLAGRHQSRIYAWIESGKLAGQRAEDGTMEVASADVLQVEAKTHRGRPSTPASRKREVVTHQPIVYYLRFRSRVKIGTTTQCRRRFAAIPCEEWCAFEPGSRSLESQRHRQFAKSRASGHHEWFEPSPELEQHMADLRMAHGDPLKLFEVSTHRTR